MRLLLTGGGTGGHIYPALALAQGIKGSCPNSQILFVGTKQGMESRIVPQNGFQLKTIDISGIDRSSPARAVRSLLKIPGALGDAKRVLIEFKPDIVVGTGGYVSFPVVYTAAKMGIKTAIHEQNAYPGIANRILASRVDLVMLTFEEAASRFRAKRIVQTGLPVRQSVLTANREQARAVLGIGEKEFVILVFGGSLGARSINQALIEMVDLCRDKHWHLIWITGFGEYEECSDKLKRIEAANDKIRIDIKPYMDNIEMAMAAADLAVCRAGASTICELEVLGLPAVLVPYPLAADNHQEKNALALKGIGAASMIKDGELDGFTLLKEIERLKEEGRLPAMSNAMKKAGHPQALDTMVSLIKELAAKGS